MWPRGPTRESGNVIGTFTPELSQKLSQRPPALTDANDAKSAKKGGLLTPTDAHRRNYWPPEPKVAGSTRAWRIR